MRGLTILLALLMLGFCCLSGGTLWSLRDSVRAAAVRQSSNLLMSEAHEIDRMLATYDALLRSAARALRDPVVARAEPGLQRLAMFARIAETPDLGPIRILDAQGRVTHDSGTLAPAPATPDERLALGRHRTGRDLELAIGPPARGADGAYHVTLSHRIEGPDGRFAGIVTGTVRLDYFVDHFRHLRLGPEDVVTLFLNDGTAIAHIPGDPLIGRSIAGSNVMRRFLSAPGGTFTSPSVFDHVTRMFAYTTIGQPRLILDVGLSTRGLYALWRTQAMVTGAVLVVLAACASLLLRSLRAEFTRRLRAEAEALNSEAQYRLLADAVSDVIFRFDADLVRTYASPSCRAFGYEPEELLGHRPGEWIHPEDAAGVFAAVRVLTTAASSEAIAYRVRRKDGGYVWIEARYRRLPDGGLVGVLRDIDARKEAEAELERTRGELARLATLDGLTGVRNRRCFDEELRRQWRRADRERHEITLLIIDCDWFKDYNDLYGHPAGDAVLKAIVSVIERCLRRPGDLLARYGGEEFTAILPDTDAIGATGVAESIRAGIAGLAIEHARSPFGSVTVSIGLATDLPRRTIASPEALLERADESLYRAKAAGRDQVRCWSPPTVPTAGRLERLESA